MPKLINYLLIAVVFFSLISCGEKSNSDRQKFIEIYGKLLIAKDKYKENTPEFVSYRKKLLEEYKVNDDFIKSQTDKLNSNPEDWNAFLKEVLEFLEAENRKN